LTRNERRECESRIADRLFSTHAPLLVKSIPTSECFGLPNLRNVDFRVKQSEDLQAEHSDVFQ